MGQFCAHERIEYRYRLAGPKTRGAFYGGLWKSSVFVSVFHVARVRDVEAARKNVLLAHHPCAFITATFIARDKMLSVIESLIFQPWIAARFSFPRAWGTSRMLHGSRDLFVSRQLNFPEDFHTNCSLNIVLPSVTLREIDPFLQRGNCSRSIHRILQQLHGISAMPVIFHRTDLQRWPLVKWTTSPARRAARCRPSFQYPHNASSDAHVQWCALILSRWHGIDFT